MRNLEFNLLPYKTFQIKKWNYSGDPDFYISYGFNDLVTMESLKKLENSTTSLKNQTSVYSEIALTEFIKSSKANNTSTTGLQKFGLGNYFISNTSGLNNITLISQGNKLSPSDYNFAVLNMFGDFNYSEIKQYGIGHNLVFESYPNSGENLSNLSVKLQYGFGNLIEQITEGTVNSIIADQFGSQNILESKVNGNYNIMKIYQDGSMNSSTNTQTGANNYISVYQGNP